MRYFIKFFAISGLISAAISDSAKAQTITIDGQKISIESLEKTARTGNPSAQYLLCLFYYNGFNTSKNYTKALKYCKISAQRDHPMAQAILGLMYKDAQGVKRDYKTALKWFHKGASGRSVIAQVSLSDIYSKGIGVRQDPVMAYMWVNVAASLDPHPDTFRIRDRAAARLSKAQLAQGQALATKCVQSNYQTCGK